MSRVHWEKLCIGTYAEHLLPAGRGYAIHINVPELMAAQRGGHTARQVALQALFEMREGGIDGLVIAHPTGIRHLPKNVTG